MNDGLTIDDLAQIKADAHKAVQRQFRDAAEDNGWTPTPTPTEESIAQADADAAASTGASLADLRNQAKELGLTASGSKADLQARINEHLDAAGDDQPSGDGDN